VSVDPVTLIVTAVALGASAGLTDTASTAIRDAYTGLKALLTRRRVDVSGVEARPESAAQQAALTETLAGNDVATDDEVLSAAQELIDAVAAEAPEAARVMGIALRDVQAEFLRVRSVTSSGDGMAVEKGRFTGGIDIGEVRAGDTGVEQVPQER
jgi:hypothetical protein